MKKISLLTYPLLGIFLHTFFLLQAHEELSIQALCTVSVSDLVTEKPVPGLFKSVSNRYEDLPITNTPFAQCSRITQLLYNEPVTIIQKDGDQVAVETEWWYSRPEGESKPDTKVNRFWMLAKDVTPIQELPLHYQRAVPGPLNSALSGQSGQIVGLKKPWHCAITKQIFSAGTRFVVQGITPTSYHVTVYNPKTKESHPCSLPKELCIVEDAHRSPHEKRKLFVSLIRSWAQAQPSIAYVLGGASFQGQQRTGSEPYNGLDCSGTIRRACRLVGIPISATNSYSMLLYFKELTPDTLPEAGDLIYWKGHIMIITNTHKHLLTEARGYTNGHGIVHEIPFRKELKGIRTTKELVRAYSKKELVKRLDPYGKAYQDIQKITLLKLL